MSKALEAARKARQNILDAGGTVERKTPLEKARANPTSLRFAVNAMCVNCMGGDDAPNYARGIRDCTAPACPLYNLRPYQGNKNVDN